MTQTLNLKPFYAAQRELDETINTKHNLSYASTIEERKLAFIVELGELANATRTFKYWSKKESESRERLLDEFADGLHFILSLGLAVGIAPDSISYTPSTDSKATSDFLNVYRIFMEFVQTNGRKEYLASFRAFLALGGALGFSNQDITTAYQKKLSVNYARQQNNY